MKSKLYKAIVEEKKQSGTLTEAVMPLIEAYCESVEGYRAVTKLIQAENKVTYQDRQVQRILPLFRQQRSYLEQLNKIAISLAITPQHRERWLGAKDAKARAKERYELMTDDEIDNFREANENRVEQLNDEERHLLKMTSDLFSIFMRRDKDVVKAKQLKAS